MPGFLWLILFIAIVAVVLHVLEIGGKPAQLIWIIVGVVVVLWLLSVFGVVNAPRGFFY